MLLRFLLPVLLHQALCVRIRFAVSTGHLMCLVVSHVFALFCECCDVRYSSCVALADLTCTVMC